MKTYFPRTPRIMMRLFSEYTWRFSSKEKELFLTFDDGPTPEITEFVLEQLKKYDAKATFFCIGKNIENHPKIFKTIVTNGHAIGNHTHHHVKGWKTKTNTYLDNVLQCKNTIENELEKLSSFKLKNSNLFRPPYGKIKKKQAKRLIMNNYKIIMWSVLSADFDTKISKEECLNNVIQNTKKGSIIVFHDSVKASKNLKYTLPKVLKIFSEKGYKFSKISF